MFSRKKEQTANLYTNVAEIPANNLLHCFASRRPIADLIQKRPIIQKEHVIQVLFEGEIRKQIVMSLSIIFVNRSFHVSLKMFIVLIKEKSNLNLKKLLEIISLIRANKLHISIDTFACMHNQRTKLRVFTDWSHDENVP